MQVVMYRSTPGLDDLIFLPRLDDATLLHNLWYRYQQDQPYTAIGPVLISINPHKPLPIYSEADVQRYHGAPLGQQAPHIFATAEQAYRGMLREGRSQVRELMFGPRLRRRRRLRRCAWISGARSAIVVCRTT
jgi:myosin heavy subunit